MRKLSILVPLLLACGGFDLEDSEGATQLIQAGSPDEAAVLALVNDRAVTQPMLDDEVGLDRRAAEGIVLHRNGLDAAVGTADDVDFGTIGELDGVRYVGKSALAKLLEYARAQGYGDTPAPEVSDREATVLAAVNHPATTFEVLDDAIGLDRRAAKNITAYRAGDDEAPGTSDDQVIGTLAELDAISYVGESAIEKIFVWALANGFGATDAAVVAEAIFSPQPFATSHAARAIELIDGAEHSLDIAMYSWSLGSVYDAVGRAIERGVKVRVIFETANKDRRADDLTDTRSGRLEALGANVRWVNKVMHHKFVIVDGPRDVAERAETCTVATGSANWSSGGASRYDENTLFLRGIPEMANAFQAEFELLWAHSRDIVIDATLPFELGTNVIDPAAIDTDADVQAYMTSDNFDARGDTFRINWGNTVSDALIDAIGRAQTSIHIASGHLRSRPVAEALIAKAEANPDMDIRVYLDGQEWISHWSHGNQLDELDECLAGATTDSQRRRCLDRGFMFGYQVGQSGIDVRYKFYSYRWHYSYAVQMHHKLMIIDGNELWTGSYNLSDNAEHNTFENMLMFRGERFAELVDAYEANFEALWETNRNDGTRTEIRADITDDHVIPLVFTPVAMTWGEVDDLKRLIRSECADINTTPFRTEPENHRLCFR